MSFYLSAVVAMSDPGVNYTRQWDGSSAQIYTSRAEAVPHKLQWRGEVKRDTHQLCDRQGAAIDTKHNNNYIDADKDRSKKSGWIYVVNDSGLLNTKLWLEV